MGHPHAPGPLCSNCSRKVGAPSRSWRPNMNTPQGRRAAILAQHPDWATEIIPPGPLAKHPEPDEAVAK